MAQYSSFFWLGQSIFAEFLVGLHFDFEIGELNLFTINR